jgi:hypothetical protein
MRTEGWENLLAKHIAEAYDNPFKWGEHDCALWCAEWIRQLTGIDLAIDWRRQYSTEDELEALLRTRGYRTPEDIADALGKEKLLHMAQRGDILLHPCGTLGICTGVKGVFITEIGVLTERTTKCLKAWGID